MCQRRYHISAIGNSLRLRPFKIAQTYAIPVFPSLHKIGSLVTVTGGSTLSTKVNGIRWTGDGPTRSVARFKIGIQEFYTRNAIINDTSYITCVTCVYFQVGNHGGKCLVPSREGVAQAFRVGRGSDRLTTLHCFSLEHRIVPIVEGDGVLGIGINLARYTEVVTRCPVGIATHSAVTDSKRTISDINGHRVF